MYKNIRETLHELKNKDLMIIIDEGRSRKRKEFGKIIGVYNRIFTILINDVLMSFSYSDLINKTIVIKKV